MYYKIQVIFKNFDNRFSTIIACGLILLIPAKMDKRILAGTRGQVAGTFSHKLVRELVSGSWAARTFFPTIDNMLYGKRWKPRQVPDWLDYPK